jgi:hypothetical protein
MQLTSQYTRIAVPHMVGCPNAECKYHEKEALDWRTEWYSPADRTRLFNTLAAVDCPSCETSVVIPMNRSIQKNANGVPTLKRSREHANKYTEQQLVVTLDQFINSEEGVPWRDYEFGP